MSIVFSIVHSHGWVTKVDRSQLEWSCQLMVVCVNIQWARDNEGTQTCINLKNIHNEFYNKIFMKASKPSILWLIVTSRVSHLTSLLKGSIQHIQNGCHSICLGYVPWLTVSAFQSLLSNLLKVLDNRIKHGISWSIPFNQTWYNWNFKNTEHFIAIIYWSIVK